MSTELTLPVDVCGLCEGALIVTERTLGRDNDEIWTEEACPRCLSVPVNDALQAFARGWLGNHQCEVLWSWPESLGSPWRDPDGGPILPLGQDAGLDLGLRWSAELLSCTVGEVRRAIESHDAANRWGYLRWPGGFSEPSGTCAGMPIAPLREAIDTIPARVPLRLRAARALKLCIEDAP